MWWEHPLVLAVGGLAVLVAGVTTIWGKGIVPAYRGVVRFFKALRKFADSIDILFDIANQFKPNGGHSLHDKIARIEARQEATAVEVSAVKEDVAGVKLDVAEVKRQVETIITEEIPIITALAEHVTESGGRR